MEIIDKFKKQIIAEVIKAYILDGLSHRKIQRDILKLPAPERGGGFVTMEILHHFNIRGDKKGILKKRSISELKKTEDEFFKKALNLIVESYIDLN